MRSFSLIWFGQLVSAVGSGITGFTLGVWVYQQTGSATMFTLMGLAATLPGVVVLPLAGSLVDRWDRRRVMVACNLLGATGTLFVIALLARDSLEVWHVYPAVCVISAASAVLQLTQATVITLLVPKEQFGRTSGMVQSAQAAAQIVPPLLAGMLLAAIHIPGLLLIDFATYLFAILMLLLARMPRVAPSGEGRVGKPPLLRGAADGWAFIRERPGLLALLVYFSINNFIGGVARALLIPMLLSFTTAQVLGTVLSVAGAGFLLGSLVMTAWGGPKDRARGVLGFGLLFGVSVMLVGLRPSVTLVAAAAFAMYCLIPLINSCSQAIWQSKTPLDKQGRVFAVRGTIALSTAPLAYLVAGPLADRVFSPIASTGVVQTLLGAGPGRGIGLVFVVAGALTVLVQCAGFLQPRLRRVEEELPDAVAEAATP
jgi:DHA3 family macrolide efflux protein-like MFS transporter